MPADHRMNIRDSLRAAVAVPVITADDVERAVELCRALAGGGLTMLEIALRTPAALAAVEAAAKALPHATVGVGPLLDAADARRARDAGARFAVSPGFRPALGEACRAAALDWLPAAITPSEVMEAREHGWTTLKFFPADAAGGPAALNNLAPVFPDVAFCPTGGLTHTTAPEYLACRNVVAVGGTWMMPKDLVASGDWAAITRLARAARALRG